MIIIVKFKFKWRHEKEPTFGRSFGLNAASFLAAASIEFAALRSSVSAIIVGSLGSTQSVPAKHSVDKVGYFVPGYDILIW